MHSYGRKHRLREGQIKAGLRFYNDIISKEEVLTCSRQPGVQLMINSGKSWFTNSKLLSDSCMIHLLIDYINMNVK